MPVPLRVSSLLITDALAGASDLYRQLGFEPVPTDDEACIGFTAGTTGVILTSREFAASCWGEPVAAELAGRVVPYVYLQHLSDSDDVGDTIFEGWTQYGTHDRIVGTAFGPMVLVERAHPLTL
ncbi:MAG: hypothetical protein K1X87_04970 [Dehalococcoidia bacterium]|nr:hypothetical protein [Dehalococcoidia bacterium]HRC62815.1 hypothetical protein [Dehalococcoidia bacterium]